MATFNPAVPQNPDYPYQSDASHPISGIAPNQSKEIALKGIATGITGGVEIAENYVEQNIKDQTHAGLDTINTSAIDRLTAAKANPTLIAMQDENPPTPEALKGLPKTLDTLDQARANNKISQTYIDMQKDALAKSLRAQFPGHRDFVDEVFSKSSREDPANRYISSLIGDINSLANAANEKRNATKTLAIEGLKQFPSSSGWDKIANEYLSGSGRIDDNALRSAYFRYSSQKADRLEEDHAFHTNEEFRKDQKQRATDIMTQRAGENARNAFYNQTFSNLNTGAKIQTMAAKIAAGTDVSSEDKQKAMNELIALRAQFITDTATEFNTSTDPSKPSYATSGGSKETQEIIENAAKTFFDPIIDQFAHDKHGLVFSSTLMNQGMEADTLHQLFNDPDKQFAQYMRVLASVGKILPPNTVDKFTLKGMADKSFDKSLWTFTTQQHVFGAAQSDGSGKPVTINAAVGTVQAATGKGAPNPEKKVAAIKNMLDDVNDITSHTVPDEIKRNTVTRFFDPSNRGFLGRFDSQGQMDVFKQFTTDPIAKEIHKLGGDSWEKYQGWVKDTFGTQLMPEAIRNLNEVTSPGTPIGWDNVNHRFIAPELSAPGSRSTLESADRDQQIRKIRTSVDRLNTGLKAVSGMNQYTGEDTNVYMYRLLKDSGYTGPLLKAIESAHMKPSKDNFE